MDRRSRERNTARVGAGGPGRDALLVRRRHPHHLLPDVVAGEEPEEGAGRVFEFVGNLLAVFEFAIASPLGRPLAGLTEPARQVTACITSRLTT